MLIKKGNKSKRRSIGDSDYIDNKEFLREIVLSKKLKRLTDRAGEMIMLLAERISGMPNFKNYSYIEDMKADGILRCCEVYFKFDEDKSDNPLAYFTQVMFFAFIQRLNKEKTYWNVKRGLEGNQRQNTGPTAEILEINIVQED